MPGKMMIEAVAPAAGFDLGFAFAVFNGAKESSTPIAVPLWVIPEPKRNPSCVPYGHV